MALLDTADTAELRALRRLCALVGLWLADQGDKAPALLAFAHRVAVEAGESRAALIGDES